MLVGPLTVLLSGLLIESLGEHHIISFLSYCSINILQLESILKNLKCIKMSNEVRFFCSKLCEKVTHVQHQLFSFLNDASADDIKLILPHIVRVSGGNYFSLIKYTPNRIFYVQDFSMNFGGGVVIAYSFPLQIKPNNI